MPECDAWSSARMCSVKRVLPRSHTASPSDPHIQLRGAATTITSARSVRRRRRRGTRRATGTRPSPHPRRTGPCRDRSPFLTASVERTQGGEGAMMPACRRRRRGRRGGRRGRRLEGGDSTGSSPDGLHVVVRVEQDRRPAVAGGTCARTAGCPAHWCRGSQRAGSRRSRTGRCRAPARPPLWRCAAPEAVSKPGNATEGMRTSAPRSARAEGMPEAAASRTASCRVRSEVMRVILSAPPSRIPRISVAKTPAAPAPSDAPSEGSVNAACREGPRDPSRAPSRRPRASAPSSPTPRRRRRAPRPSSPRSARRPASAWPPATPSTSRRATRVRSASSSATSSTAAGTSARSSCPRWCSSSSRPSSRCRGPVLLVRRTLDLHPVRHRRHGHHSIRVKRSAKAKFGDDKIEKGLGWYAAMRIVQMRFLRLPKPQVKRGQRPA